MIDSPLFIRSGALSIWGALAASAGSPWLSPLVRPDSAFASTPTGLVVADGRAYLTTGETLAVFDVSNPAAPTFLGFDATRGSTTGLAVREGFAFLVDGLDVHDVGDPESLELPVVASFPPSDNRTFSGIGRDGDFVFCQGYATPLTIFTFADLPGFPAGEGIVVPDNNGSAENFFARTIKLSGDILYLAGGDDDWGALKTYRFIPDDPEHPGTPSAEFLGEFRIVETESPPTGSIREIEIIGGIAYIADTGLGLALIDVSNPAVPSLLTVLSPEPGDIARSGNFLLATEPAGFLRIYDITNPAAPVARGAISLEGEASQLAVSGTTAWVAGIDMGLVSVDFSNPDALEVVGGIEISNKRVRVVAPAGDTLYALGDGGLDVYDVSDRRQPSLVSPGSGGAHQSLAVDGSTAAAQLEGSSSVEIYDLGPNGRTPTLLTQSPIDNLRNIVLSQGRLFACTRGDGLRIYDVSASGALTERASWGAADDKWVERVAVAGSLALVYLGSHPAGDPGFVILDISDIDAPVQIGSRHGLFVRAMVVVGNLAYVLDPTSLLILDISDPADPRISGNLTLPDPSPEEIVLAGGFAFVRRGYPDFKVSVIDVLDPTAPFLVTADAGIDGVQSLAADGGFLHLGRDELGLQILDLTLPVPQLEISRSALRLDWDAPEGTRFPVESSYDLKNWQPHGRLGAPDLESLFESFDGREVFLRARPN